jgi:hypothetical protein
MFWTLWPFVAVTIMQAFFGLRIENVRYYAVLFKAYSTRLKLYGLYLLAVKTLCRKFTKFSPRIGQPTETRFCFLSSLFESV